MADRSGVHSCLENVAGYQVVAAGMAGDELNQLWAGRSSKPSEFFVLTALGHPRGCFAFVQNDVPNVAGYPARSVGPFRVRVLLP